MPTNLEGLKMLKAGADETINYRTEDVGERIKALTGGRGVDVVNEITTREHIRFDNNYESCSSASANMRCDHDAGHGCCAFAPSWRKPRACVIPRLLKQALVLSQA